jgi:hypothetical protein
MLSHLQPMSAVAREGDIARYAGEYRPAISGPLLIAVRVRPKHPDLLHPIEPGLVKWA